MKLQFHFENFQRKETPKEDILMSKEDNVEAFLNKVSHMIDKISVFRDKGNNLPKYTEVQLFAEVSKFLKMEC